MLLFSQEKNETRVNKIEFNRGLNVVLKDWFII